MLTIPAISWAVATLLDVCGLAAQGNSLLATVWCVFSTAVLQSIQNLYHHEAITFYWIENENLPVDIKEYLSLRASPKLYCDRDIDNTKDQITSDKTLTDLHFRSRENEYV